METPKNALSPSSKSAKSSGGHRALKTAGVLAAIGVATLAVAKGLKTTKGRALEKKAVAKGKKILRKAKSVTGVSSRRGTRKTAARAR